ncbi:MAG: hypothetical protein KGJ49_04435 [Alphaproteobacteria bacterium]|nr:hypothetical protein [Alphaproteobacteria bacterium]
MKLSLVVYWARHCSSCEKVKEFLKLRGIDFELVNILENPGALVVFSMLDIRSVPVVMRGENFVYAQSLYDVAKFVDVVSLGAARLSVDQMIGGMDAILAGARAKRLTN